MNVGDEFVLDISSIAHGGHFVARHEGRVIFVRHAISGEKVKVRITEISKNFARGDAVEIVNASKDRIAPACRYAKPDGCGGCDFQHVEPQAQRSYKAAIIKEQFKRLAKMDIEVEVEEVAPTQGWRSRMQFTVSENRKIAMYQARSNKLIEIDECKIAHQSIKIADLNAQKLPAGKKVDVAVGSDGEVVVAIEGRENFALVNQNVNGFNFSLTPESFWQSHIAAPKTLVDAVLEFAELKIGDHLYDLYSGVGLFASSALKLIGDTGRITLIEESASAITDARRNFANYANVEIVEGKVERELKRFVKGDVVIIDPPRSGAGERVIRQILALSPRTLIYVACDPAALARDTEILERFDYALDGIRAFDLFPMTQHIESVARFIRRG
ncbi:MAG: class I SAM-dependent RNA methyltransferase [Actinobacteria bacterium]|jgi:tRNA/tmRNA/rRNA uracil-C5-methylase (TrmA/RlmC/RlmD family)|nr:class I SAM-dependent RNA methyltransferase [Actinomycetota bacterium]NCV95820.1 class I SAM-dependent RNA methyltransferase [Actinomycetota bacterium]NCW46530.1 class I SAM-dependent RNA methyltransferase [Actinomycetota bacterium]NCW93524.1 class I SAM-dependent RNA methyltransferase [Actinomycetota bacterium]NCW96368.1 class I SAM-dependent RNA methyltransferase [Actinomycetota bacterium]